MKSNKRIKQFGGDNRVFLTDDILSNIAEGDTDRLSDEAREALDILKEGFQTLSPLERQVIGALISESEITYAQIAETVSSTEGAVTLAVHRAKKKLQKFAKENADGSIYIESMLKGLANDEE